MGDTVWVLKEGQDEDDWDHSLLLREEKALKKLAQKLGVAPLEELLDYSILSEEFDDDEAEPNYLNPADIKPTLSALITALKADGAGLKNPAEVLEELEDCLKKVQAAEDEQCKVRLSIVP